MLIASSSIFLQEAHDRRVFDLGVNFPADISARPNPGRATEEVSFWAVSTAAM
jgi:hypothetical protein